MNFTYLCSPKKVKYLAYGYNRSFRIYFWIHVSLPHNLAVYFLKLNTGTVIFHTVGDWGGEEMVKNAKRKLVSEHQWRIFTVRRNFRFAGSLLFLHLFTNSSVCRYTEPVIFIYIPPYKIPPAPFEYRWNQAKQNKRAVELSKSISRRLVTTMVFDLRSSSHPIYIPFIPI